MFAVFASTGAGSASIARRDYWHVDHLVSIVAVSDQTGAVTQRFAYDPFGKRRFTNGAFDASNELFIDWTRFANRNSSGTLFTTLLGSERGFTGHEHLDDLGLIHMNGRIFDPLIGRFLQADPFVQFPDALAAYNRYSYVLNNPLNATDPTGYFLKRLWRNQYFRLAVAIVVAAYAGYGDFSWVGGTASGLTSTAAANAFVGGFVAGAINSGTLDGAAMGGFTAMAFYGAGQFANGMELSALADGGFASNSSQLWGPTGIGRALAHAGAGCASAGLQGGDCGQGALSAGVTKYAGSQLAGPVNGVNDMVRETAVQAGIGGTVSMLTGGSFSNGATNAAYQYLFNYLSEEMIAQWGAESQREAGWSAAGWVSTSDRALMEAGFDLLDPTRGGMRAMRMSATASKWGKQHGGNDHWKILTKIADGLEAKGWQNIRINRRQVDSQGTVVGRNRPDISATSPRGIRYNIEVDTLRASAVRHHSRLMANDPNSRVRLVPVR